MGQCRKPEKVKLICAVLRQETFDPAVIQDRLVELFGDTDHCSPDFSFDYSGYYAGEMGEGLCKMFMSFARLIFPEDIVAIKHQTNHLETEWSQHGKRCVNLDPGYVTGAKLVLATTKNFAHRVYMGDCIYGDNQLRYIHGRWQVHEWTYPDYTTSLADHFLKRVREIYLNQLEQA